MSSSDNTMGSLVVTAPEALISVSDAAFRPVPDGTAVGLLSVDLPPGPYRVSARIGLTEASETVVVQPGLPTSVCLDVQFESAAPAKRIRTTESEHIRLTSDACDAVARAGGPQAGLVIVLRDTSQTGGHTPLARNVVLRDSHRRQVSPRRGRWRESTSDSQVATWAVRLRPGGYTLSVPDATGKTTVEQSVWLAERWLTLMFLPVGAAGPLQAMASVHLVPLDNAGWDPGAEETFASEVILTGLRDGSPALSPDSMKRLRGGDYQNPMFAILAAHALINTFRSAELLDTIVAHLEDMVGRHPDVLALRACARLLDQDEPGLSVPWPPMLADSYKCLLEADRVNPAVLPAGSTAERIAAAQLASGPWLQWTAMGDPKRSGRSAAASVLFAHLERTAARMDSTWTESAKALGTPELARRLAMPESLIKDGLRTLRARERD